MMTRGSFQSLGIAFLYSIIGIILGFILIFVAIVTAYYVQVEFPTQNDGAYGFLMKDVQTRVPLANSGRGSVNTIPYNPNYTEFGVSPGAPINPTAYYNSSKPFSTSAWWSRLVSQKSDTPYVVSMPYVYSGCFNLYRSKAYPNFGITIARPYCMNSERINATKVCGQTVNHVTISRSIQDAVPTIFNSPLLWNQSQGRIYNFGSEVAYSARDLSNMSCEMTYSSVFNNERFRLVISQNVPYINYFLSPASSLVLNVFFQPPNNTTFETLSLVNLMPPGPPPYTIPSATLVKFRTQVSGIYLGGRPPLGDSQTSQVEFLISFTNACSLTQDISGNVVITNLSSEEAKFTVLPVKYYVNNPISLTEPQAWVNIDSVVASTILASGTSSQIRAFISSSTYNGQAVVTYATANSEPLIFVPTLTMLDVGSLSGAELIATQAPPNNFNLWLSPQQVTGIYIATTGRFDVNYPLVTPPPFGQFDIYSAFDANSLKRLNFIFNRDLEALYSVNVNQDSFYTSVRKIFTYAQMTYAIFNFPASVIVNAYLPPIRAYLMQAFDDLLSSKAAQNVLGYNSQLFTVATSTDQYGESQNQMFGDNHVGQYGMLLFTYYIIVAIQFDNSARAAAKERYQSVMVDLMRDFAQPYETDLFIPSMRHFDFGNSISWQSSSIIEVSSLQVAEVINGYYACWLVASLFGDTKLQNFYRAVLSIETATQIEYRLTSLPTSDGSHATSAINKMIDLSEKLFRNCSDREFRTESPAFYRLLGTMVYNIHGGEIILHAVRLNDPEYKYMVEQITPNNVGDWSATVFYRPMTPLTIQTVPLTLGINLNTYQAAVFSATNQTVGLGAPIGEISERPEVQAVDLDTGLPTQVISLEANPSSYLTVEASYSLSSYAVNYVTNYTWPGANLPEGTCSVIASDQLPVYLNNVMQYNKLGVLDSNTVYWIQYVITAYGPRNY